MARVTHPVQDATDFCSVYAAGGSARSAEHADGLEDRSVEAAHSVAHGVGRAG